MADNFGNNGSSAYPVHPELLGKSVSRDSFLASNLASSRGYDQILNAVSDCMKRQERHENSNVIGDAGLHSAISDLIMKQALTQKQSQYEAQPGPSNLPQRGVTALKTCEMVDFEGRVATRNDVIKVNPVYPLGIVRDSSKVFKSGRDLPSTNNVKAYPKAILPNHTRLYV